MDRTIKDLADKRDLKSLKYIFSGALDADPTFEQYAEDYDYCRSIPGLLEPHRELTPFVYDSSLWNDEYWADLKMDLISNFSEKRMEHMIEVAKVYMRDDIERVMASRAAADAAKNAKPRMESNTGKVSGTRITGTYSKVDLEERERKIAELERRNREADERVREAAERVAEAERKIAEAKNAEKSKKTSDSKKAFGVAAVLLAAVIIIIILIIMLK